MAEKSLFALEKSITTDLWNLQQLGKPFGILYWWRRWTLTLKYPWTSELSTTRPVPSSPVSTCPGWGTRATPRWRGTSTATFMRRRVINAHTPRARDLPSMWLQFHWLFTCEVYVRKCIVDKGEDYRGKVATTRSGLTCQQWWSKFPHDHRWDASKVHRYVLREQEVMGHIDLPSSCCKGMLFLFLDIYFEAQAPVE